MGGTPACQPSLHCYLLLRATGAMRPVLMIPVKTQAPPLLSSWPRTGPSPILGQLAAPRILSCAHPDNWRGCPGLPWPCPWTGSEARSPAAHPLCPRAQLLGAAAPPALRTWLRKAEWPAGAPQGWRPRSLSVTRSTTRCPPVGVRAEGLRHTTAPLDLGTTDWISSLHAPGARALPEGTKEAGG